MAQPASGKNVLITGTSTGIGRAAALHLHQLGYNVIATVRKEADAAALQADAQQATAFSHLRPLLLDVTDEHSLAQAKETLAPLLNDHGLWGLVNNAGVGFTGPLEFVPLEDMHRLFAVNLFGVLAVTQLCLPYLRRARGRILNISSTASLMVAPFHGPYSTSKFALNALSQALRLELKPFGIQVSTLVCGSIKTPIWTKTSWSNRIWAALPEAAQTLYGARFTQLINYFQQIGRSGLPPEAVARVMATALSAHRAKTTYYIGRDAQLYWLLTRLVGERQRDWLVLRTTGLAKIETSGPPPRNDEDATSDGRTRPVPD